VYGAGFAKYYTDIELAAFNASLSRPDCGFGICTEMKIDTSMYDLGAVMGISLFDSDFFLRVGGKLGYVTIKDKTSHERSYWNPSLSQYETEKLSLEANYSSLAYGLLLGLEYDITNWLVAFADFNYMMFLNKELEYDISGTSSSKAKLELDDTFSSFRLGVKILF
jgi:opacity protein-like surface antigen